ncbi:MAG: hypothetical protein ABI369_12070 [Acetobacteraceae bacterium]
MVLALSPPARAGAGGMGHTGQDGCDLINLTYSFDEFGNPQVIDDALQIDPGLPNPPCDFGTFPQVFDSAGMPLLDLAGFPVVDVPKIVCNAFDVIAPGACSLIPEPGRFPLMILVIGASGIVASRAYRRRA